MKRSGRGRRFIDRLEKFLELTGKIFLVRIPAAVGLFVLARTALGISASDGAVSLSAFAVLFWLAMEWVWAQARDIPQDDEDHPSWW